MSPFQPVISAQHHADCLANPVGFCFVFQNVRGERYDGLQVWIAIVPDDLGKRLLH